MVPRRARARGVALRLEEVLRWEKVLCLEVVLRLQEVLRLEEVLRREGRARVAHTALSALPPPPHATPPTRVARDRAGDQERGGGGVGGVGGVGGGGSRWRKC